MKFKPCPFCGSEVKEKPNGFIDWACRCNIIIHSQEWNTRPIEEQQAEQIREIETRNNALMCIGVKKEEQYKAENQRLKELLFACYDDVSQAMQAKIDKERNGQ